MGLDPPTRKTLPPLLYNLAQAQAPRILLSLRPQDSLPGWITHVVLLGPELRVDYQGLKEEAPFRGQKRASRIKPFSHSSKEALELLEKAPPSPGEPIIRMQDVVVRYGDKTVLGNWQETIDGEIRHGLQWTVRRGERWGVFGPNGIPPPSRQLGHNHSPAFPQAPVKPLFSPSSVPTTPNLTLFR